MKLLNHFKPRGYDEDEVISILLLFPWDHYKGWWGFGTSGVVRGRIFQEKTRFSLGPIAIMFTGCCCAECRDKRYKERLERKE